jgi:hypothetical protein
MDTSGETTDPDETGTTDGMTDPMIVPVLPDSGQLLTPARAYLFWRDETGLPGAYDVCWTTGPESSIDDDNDCPQSVASLEPYAVISPLEPGQTYRWKVRKGAVTSPIAHFITGDALVAWWPMNGNADDAAGVHDGQLQGGALFGSGLDGEALQLDGIDGLMTAADAPELSFGADDFAISLFLRLQPTGTYQSLVDKRDADALYQWFVDAEGSLLFGASDCPDAVIGAQLIADDQWHHVVLSRNASEMELWIDGALDATETCAGNLTAGGPLTLGCNAPPAPCTEPVLGSIEDMMIHAGGLDTAAVQQMRCAMLAVSGADPLAEAACNP